MEARLVGHILPHMSVSKWLRYFIQRFCLCVNEHVSFHGGVVDWVFEVMADDAKYKPDNCK